MKILTYNLHKGKRFWTRKYELEQMRNELLYIDADIVLLQELSGIHKGEIDSNLDPINFLADNNWPFFYYGMNFEGKKGNHGNAILSKFELNVNGNVPISQTRFAKRGMLHGTVEYGGKNIHLLNVHLDLFEKARAKQIHFILNYIKKEIPPWDVVVLGGDFNDWRKSLDVLVDEAFESSNFQKRSINTFPSIFPVLNLDRFYLKNVQKFSVDKVSNSNLRLLSDHLPLLLHIDDL